MKWATSQRFGRPAWLLAIACLATAALCSPYNAIAKTGGGFEAPPQGLEPAPPQVSASGHEFERTVPAVVPLMLAQAASRVDEDKKTADANDGSEDGNDPATEAPNTPAPSGIWVVNALRADPILAIFLTLAIGYWVGTLKIGEFSVGSVTGVLIVGIAVGQLTITISPQLKSMFFLFFLFAVGYGIGPQFVRGIAKDGGPQVLFAVIVSLMCLGAVYLAARLAGYGPGLAAGMLAGSQTISAALGLATDAINGLGLGDQAQAELKQMPVAYAVCYIFGTFGTGWMLAFLGPKLIGADMKAECKRYEQEMSGDEPESDEGTAWHQFDLRTFEVAPDIVDKTVAEAEASISGARIFTERIKRGRKIFEVKPTTVLKADDVVAVSGPTEQLVERIAPVATEVVEPDLLRVPTETAELVVTNRAYNGMTVKQVGKKDVVRGVHLTKITRGAVSVDVPLFAGSKIYRGDILTITGVRANTERVIAEVGYADRPSPITDMTWVGIFVVIGGLLGALTFEVKGVPLTLSTSAGVLIAGIVLGWLRSVRPTFGQVPAPSLWFMNSVGLNVFIAVVGISAGTTFIDGLKEAGISLFLWGVFASAVPILLAPLIGKYVFRFDPAINLGICAGARTSTAFVAMVEDMANSNVPMLGYTVPFAVGTTMNTLWGMVIVLLIGTGPAAGGG